eukprot:scaffold3037_cov109-Ochromonas_danica.AAC.1
MLRGNLFACPERDLENNVPETDPYRLQYGCGSDDLNSALLVWTGLLVLCEEREEGARGEEGEGCGKE